MNRITRGRLLFLLAVLAIFACGCAENGPSPAYTEETHATTTASTTETTPSAQTDEEESQSNYVRISDAHVSLLQSEMGSSNGGNGMPIYDFTLIFGESCIRNMHSETYAVFEKMDGNRVFVFFDHEGKADFMLETLPFMTKEEFEKHIQLKESSLSELMEITPNVLLSPTSSVPVAYFYVREGLFVLLFYKHFLFLSTSYFQD